MIVWVVAGLLALGTGLRIGWALVNRQSVVSGAMIVALGSLAVLAALNWAPLTLLVDTAIGWPNIAVALSQVALVASAAGSCVMITSVSATRAPVPARRLAVIQYAIAAVVAAVSLGMFLTAPRQPEMAPQEYLSRATDTGNMDSSTGWLIPLLYVLLATTLVTWVGIRLSNPTRRGRALFLFSAGTALIVAASAFILIRAVRGTPLVGVGTAATLLLCAMSIVAAGSLLPSVEDWVGARRELRLIDPLLQEMSRRHADVGIGIRPRGPLVFRVAERLSTISDSLYLEAMLATDKGAGDGEEPVGVSPSDQARAVADWLHAGRDEVGTAFPGNQWLRQPPELSDREWILAIARQYRDLRAAPAPAVRDSADAGGERESG